MRSKPIWNFILAASVSQRLTYKRSSHFNCSFNFTIKVSVVTVQKMNQKLEKED